MSTKLSPQTLRAIASVAAGRGRCVRFAMRGRSMLPLLREPMILELAPIARRPHVGDIIVFTCGEFQVAHRIVRYAGDRFVTSGDGQPYITETVAPRDVLGRVESIWENGSASARRVDVGVHRLCGLWYARTHRMRAQAARLRALAGRVLVAGRVRKRTNPPTRYERPKT